MPKGCCLFFLYDYAEISKDFSAGESDDLHIID